MNPFSLLQFLPVIMVPWRPSGQPVIRNASLSGLKMCGFVIIALGMIIYFWFLKWYQAHSVWGKIIVWTAAVWCVLRLIGIIRSFCDDPYTRVKSDTYK